MKYLNIVGTMTGKVADDKVAEIYNLAAYYEGLVEFNKTCKKEEKKIVDDLVINIDTLGGAVKIFSVLYNVTKKLPCKIITRCYSEAYSVGLYLFLLGDIREASETTKFMWHECAYGFETTISKQAEYANVNLEMQDFMNKYIISRTDITKDMLAENKYKELYINYKEAKKLGIVTPKTSKRKKSE